jgi:hypothetical protein
MHLMTLQGRSVLAAIYRYGVYRAPWPPKPDDWRLSYQWMARQMARRGVPTHGKAPVWCWARDAKFGGPPNHGTARMLLSDIAIEAGIWVIDLDVPDRFCVRSHYGRWNLIMDHFYDHGTPPPSDLGIFDVPRSRAPRFRWQRERIDEPDQVCVPLIAHGWVVRVLPLPFRLRNVERRWHQPI